MLHIDALDRGLCAQSEWFQASPPTPGGAEEDTSCSGPAKAEALWGDPLEHRVWIWVTTLNLTVSAGVGAAALQGH